jgi:hypothetical protein
MIQEFAMRAQALLKKKEIGDSSAKTSIDKGKPKPLERTKLYDFHIDDSNIDSQKSSSTSPSLPCVPESHH